MEAMIKRLEETIAARERDGLDTTAYRAQLARMQETLTPKPAVQTPKPKGERKRPAAFVPRDRESGEPITWEWMQR
jgi:hypothetical protein